MGISKFRGIVEQWKVSDYGFFRQDLGPPCNDRVIVDISTVIWRFVDNDGNILEDQLFLPLVGLKTQFKSVVCVFDGMAPVQKLKEQLQRRIVKKEKAIRTQTKIPSLDFFDPKYKAWRHDFEQKLQAEGIIVITSDIPGEADHKIFTFLRTTDWAPTVIITNDWDLYVRTLCGIVEKVWPEDEIFYSSPTGTYGFTEIPDPIGLIQTVMIFGSDYYPGIGNFRLVKKTWDRIRSQVHWISNVDENIKISISKFRKWIKQNQDVFSDIEQTMEDYIPEIESLNSTEDEPFFDQANWCQKKCVLCTKKHKNLNIIASAWMNILEWTLNHYFHKSDNSSIVYPFGYAPTPMELRAFLKWNNASVSEPCTIGGACYTSEELWNKYSETANVRAYKFCPRRPAFYSSQQSIDFFHS